MLRSRFSFSLSLLALFAVLFASFAFPAAAFASSPDCSSSPCSIAPSLPADQISREETFSLASSSSALALPQLKAVVVVGPIDGPTGSWTTSEIANAESAANELSARGVQVTKFYSPNTPWAQITAAAQGAHFFIYRGHGINWGGSPETVGGLALDNGTYISSNAIRSDLHLAQNAIVLIYACFSAGSSSSDAAPGVSRSEAIRRVAQYSEPFMANGAAAYYADWYGYAFKYFIADLFSGKTFEQAYKAFDFNANTFGAYSHPNFPSLSLWVSSDYFSGATQHNHAFVGKTSATLSSLFAPSMTLSKSNVNLAASTTTASPLSTSVAVSGSTPVSFSWSASLVNPPAWASLSPASGLSGQSLSLTLDPRGLEPGTYSASLRVTANTPGVQSADQTVPVTFRVFDYSNSVFLPSITR